MPTPETWIARPGELITSSVEEVATRVGGLPLFPSGCRAPDQQLTACQACGQQLALILQAYVPLPAGQGLDQAGRFLYLYGCTAEGCGKQPGCWRALRLTLPSTASGSGTAEGSGSGTAAASAAAPRQQQQQRQQPPAPAHAPAPPADDWGVSGADHWGAGGGDDWGADDAAAAPGAAATFDFGDLNAALEAVGSAAPAKAPGKQQAQAGSEAGNGSSSTAGPAYDAARRSLPAFYLYAEPESQCTGGSGGSSKQSQEELEHLQELMARYEQEAAVAGGAAAAGAGVGAAAAGAGVGAAAGGAATACLPFPEGGPESWGGEGYEEDAVLAPAGGKKAGVGAAYFKFSKQLAKCPDQCARYSFGGSPLWPSSQPPPPVQPCSACGGPRVFELQLMTPVIPALLESAEWLAAEGASAAAAGALLQPPDSWEWLTVCVYSCAASCGGGGGGPVLVQEHAALANEDQ